jgi:outer membrane biosynthesis protein TonB
VSQADRYQDEENELNAALDKSRAELDSLASELGRINGDLAGLDGDHEQYKLLQDVCVGLQQLEERGGAGLFWDGIPGVDGADHVGRMRARADEFFVRFDEFDSVRRSLVDRIEKQRLQSEWIEEELFELNVRREELGNDWVIEREVSDLPPRTPVMPWAHGGEDDRRLRKTMGRSLLAALLFMLLMPLIPLPEVDRLEPVEVPERLTRLLQERKPVVPAPPPEPVETLTEEPTEQVAEEKVEKPKREVTPEARERVETKGVLAFRDNFADLAENVSKVETMLGAQARINRSGGETTSRSRRSMVTTTAPGASSGINVASLSREVVGGGGSGMEGVEVGQATSSIGALTGPERKLAGGPGPSRTDEEIQIVFDRHKAALYRLYNRALRQNPTLRGQMVLKLTIEPDGSVSACAVESSDMKAPKLGAQVVSRVKTFDFGAKEGVAAITILYPIDFLPAT